MPLSSLPPSANPRHLPASASFGQFLAGSLPAPGAPESGLELSGAPPDTAAACQTIVLRNKCLQIVANVAEQDAQADPARLDEWMTLLGYDWLLLFLQVGPVDASFPF